MRMAGNTLEWRTTSYHPSAEHTYRTPVTRLWEWRLTRKIDALETRHAEIVEELESRLQELLFEGEVWPNFPEIDRTMRALKQADKKSRVYHLAATMRTLYSTRPGSREHEAAVRTSKALLKDRGQEELTYFVHFQGLLLEDFRDHEEIAETVSGMLDRGVRGPELYRSALRLCREGNLETIGERVYRRARNDFPDEFAQRRASW